MFLLDSGSYATNPQQTEETIREYLSRCEAEVVAVQPWQEGKLAYAIDGHRKGLHYLTFIKMDGAQVEHLNRICKLSDVVIRHLILEHEPRLFDLMVQHLAEHETAHTGEPETEGAAAG